MFLLMGIGYIVAGSVLISEVIGGCANKCRKLARRASNVSIAISNTLSHPNSTNTGRTDDKDDSHSIFPASWNGSSDNILRRRQSEQISSRTIVRRGHQRHNSLVDPDYFRASYSTSLSARSADGIAEHETIDGTLKPIGASNKHTVEINRSPTPFPDVDESFGEKVVN